MLGLRPEEVRALGCLVEKERATPQNYPLTPNALRLACNQATNRDPVVDYDDHTIEAALVSLRERGFTRIVYSTHNRVPKHRHVLDEVLGLDERDLAVLCVLALRGPQTVGEIKGRSDRLFAFADLGEVQATLDRLAARGDPLCVRLERRPGQKDARYAHLLGDAAASGADATPQRTALAPATPSPAPAPGLSPALPSPPVEVAEADRPGSEAAEALRREVADLRGEVAQLRADFEAFRGAFE